MKLILGSQLSPQARAQVLNAFIYRWTTGNTQRARVYKCAKCDVRTPYQNTISANGHTHPTMPLISDEQWLNEHAFWITKDGSLARNRNHAEPAFMVETA